MGLNNGLHSVPVRIEPGQSSLAQPPFNNNNNNERGIWGLKRPSHVFRDRSGAETLLLRGDEVRKCMIIFFCRNAA